MNVAVIGLGKMGHAIALKMHQSGMNVTGYDRNSQAIALAAQQGIAVAHNLEELRGSDVFWLMIPAGEIVDRVIADIIPLCSDNTIIVDGGNSFYQDSQRRATLAQHHGSVFLDCGTSGGIHGIRDGFCLMIGGQKEAYETLIPLFEHLSVPGGYAHVGGSGAGHYVKMVHNGIEYGLMQAYAEGLHILKEGSFKHESLDVTKITALWNTNAVIRSFLLSLMHQGLSEDQSLSLVSGKVAESGMGLWTDQEARMHNIPGPVLQQALAVRAQSRKTGGNYGTKIVSLLRNKFGGHNCRE